MSLVKLVIVLFSILLITQSIFGCPLKHHHVKRNPGSSTNDTEIQGRQGSTSISLKEGDKQNKRKDVIAAATLGFTVLQHVLSELGSVSRKVAIGISNKSGMKWHAINSRLKHGTSDQVLPYEILSGEALTYGARKTAGYWPRGVEGVFTYYIDDIRSTLAVMFSVPYNYLWNKNQFEVRLYKGMTKTADDKLFNTMYKDYVHRMKGNNHWRWQNLNERLKARCYMSSSSAATIDIEIERQPMSG